MNTRNCLNRGRSILPLIATLCLPPAAFAQSGDTWTAYNDCAFKTGQANADNVTTFGIGRSFEGEGTSGSLKNFTDGSDTGVTVTFTEYDPPNSGSVNSAGDAATYTPGTDAASLFEGKVDLAGNISYADAPGWYVDLTISGLDPNRLYTFAATADRNGGAGYADRVTNWRIMGADSSTYASSPGAHRVSDDSVEFSTGENSAGYVAKWTDIAPGSDGTVVIRTSHSVGEANGGIPGAHAYKGYAGGVFLLTLQPNKPFLWQAFDDCAYKSGQDEATNVTTYGIGRSFEGEGTSGELKELATGQGTGITATFTEYDPENSGSVNSAGDPADYTPGSDAAAVFGGIVDLAGNISYADAPGWYVDLTFTGMDPAKRYTFVGTVDRAGGAGYADRVTNWKLMGADSSSYASSAGAHKVSDNSVEFSTGDNSAGYVAKWTDIAPGSDGTIVIRTSHSVGEANGGIPGAHAYKGYAGGVFMLAEQTASSTGGKKPVEIFSLFPADGVTNASPNTPVQAVIQHNSQVVDLGSVHLFFDGTEVPPTVGTNDTSTSVSYNPPAMLASSSSHTVRLTFKDNAPSPNSYTNEWSFQVLDYSAFPTYPASLAEPFDPAKYTTRGFAMKIVAPDPSTGWFFADTFDAQDVFNQQLPSLVDPSIFNSLGYYIEPDTINYQIDGASAGNRAGDRKFPGIQGSGQPGDMFAIQLWTYLHLKPGYYHFNITMSQQFDLWIGQGANEQEVPTVFTDCTNCGGDDAPWYTDFLIAKEGLYPFRLVFFSNGGSASLEWLAIAPNNAHVLINEHNPDAIEAYVPVEDVPPTPKLTIERDGASVVISWQSSATLQQSQSVTGPWSDVTSAASPFTAPTTAGQAFYRLKL